MSYPPELPAAQTHNSARIHPAEDHSRDLLLQSCSENILHPASTLKHRINIRQTALHPLEARGQSLKTLIAEHTVDICREFLPRADLRNHVECVWNTAPIEDTRFEIVPDGCVDVCFILSPQRPRTLLFGTTTHTISYELEPGVPYLGVRFRPGSASLFARGQVTDLTDTSVDLSNFLGITAEEMLNAKSFADQRSRIESAILKTLLGNTPQKQNTIRRAVSLIDSSHGNIRIRDLARQCDLSPRQLERHFLEHVGITPKLYSRIRRFRSVLDHFQDPPEPQSPGAAELAAAFGYADQSHLIRDFRDFSHPLPRPA